MPEDYLHWLGVHEFVAALEEGVARMSEETRKAVIDVASKVEEQAKVNASGRPGPEVVSGALRRGITMDRTATPWGVGGWQTKVGPTVIYSRRIELGFKDIDSRGRYIEAGAYPYLGPAIEAVKPRIPAIYAGYMSKAITGV